MAACLAASAAFPVMKGLCMDAGLQGEQGTRRPRINAGIEESRTACLRARGGLFRAFSFFFPARNRSVRLGSVRSGKLVKIGLTS